MNEKTLEGRIATTRSGVGFLTHPDFKDDIRIQHEHLNTAFNGDTVAVRLHAKRKGKQQTGEVTKVLKRSITQFVGVLEKEKDLYFLVPDDRRVYTDILIPNPPDDVPNGYKVVVKLTQWDDPAKDPQGAVLRVLGPRGDHEVEIQSIVAARGIDTTFPDDVAAEAQKIKKEWDKESSTYIETSIQNKERKDFREIPTFTIDPYDAKDFDDALSFREITSSKSEKTNKQTNKLYEVGIHIADVSHFVKPGSVLDSEARERGFSTYLVDRTIPMLPEELSNDLCSLNPDTDRLSYSAVFVLDEEARVQDRWFGRGVIHSDKRFTYQEAQDTLNKKGGVFKEELSVLNALAKTLRARRMKEGSIDFDREEVEIELDEKNRPSRIYRKKLLDTNKLIEDFMLLANREVAKNIFRAHEKKEVERAFIYRVHEHPDREKLQQVQMLIRAVGHDLGNPGSRIDARDINQLFKEIKGEPIENTIKTALIRTMARAEYGTKNIGHFGLGFEHYTHFTSPIRRYPDLLVHRLLEEHLKSKHIPQSSYQSFKQLAWELSQKEAAIQEAERESIKYKQVEYMTSHIGEAFTGIITGVTEWGIYVEEEQTGAEGLVRISSIKDDYYIFDEKHFRLRGKRTKKTYALGDTVRMKITGANVDQKTIDLILV